MSAPPDLQLSDSLEALETVLTKVRAQVREARGRTVAANVSLAETSALSTTMSPTELAAKAGRIYKGRRARDAIFEGLSLFADPAWDILLDLFIAGAAQQRISVSSSTIAACVAPTTALRWIDNLLRDGLIAREPDPHDRRRSHLRLSDQGYALMTEAIARF